MLIEKVYSAINDKNIKTNLSGSTIWKNCHTEDEYKSILSNCNQMFCYSIKFDGLIPVQVTKIKQVK